jgi:hypothetical protein
VSVSISARKVSTCCGVGIGGVERERGRRIVHGFGVDPRPAGLDKAALRHILYVHTVVVAQPAPTMNAPLLPEILRLRDPSPQEPLPLATEGVQRYVWEGRFGSMLIEVVDGIAYVNGERVEAVADAPDAPDASA